MSITYFKRYRMEIDLQAAISRDLVLPSQYRFIPWKPHLLELHADAKYRSFRSEVDSYVFPCLGEPEGCLRLMEEISLKHGFLPQATWLVVHHGHDGVTDYCGTIQGVEDLEGAGGVQNVGVTPEHRGLGLGTKLIYLALNGFRRCGLRQAYLEVTARNSNAVRLYQSLGFRKVRTSYKAVEVEYA